MSKFNPDLVIDGSIGEGGGSILRLSVGLACALKKSIEIRNIRANRKKPGLRLQHLVGVETLTEITGGFVNDLKIGSTNVRFSPGNKWINETKVHIQTAGSIGMLSQSLYNGLYFAPVTEKGYRIIISGGGTYGKWAPGTDYLNNVTFQILKQLGYSVKINVSKHGFYPKGGAQAEICIKPNNKSYSGYNKEIRGELSAINVSLHVEDRLRKPQVAERIGNAIKENLQKHNVGDYISINSIYHNSRSVGVGVDAWLEFENGVILGAATIIGERGISSEKIGSLMAQNIIKLLKSDATIDEHAADQILPFLCLIDKPSKFLIEHPTSHFLTNLKILEQFTGRKGNLIKQSPHLFLFNYE